MNGKEIKLIRKKLGLTQQQFADKLNYSLSMVQKWENGAREIDEFTAGVIQQFESEISNMYQKAAQKIELQHSNEKIALNNSGVPYYDIDYAGGWSSEEVFTNQLPSFFITSPDFEKAEFACNLIGQSISRRIPHRAVIGLRQINDWELYFPTNEVYAVLMKNELRTVKIVKRSEKEGFLTLIPDPRIDDDKYRKYQVSLNTNTYLKLARIIKTDNKITTKSTRYLFRTLAGNLLINDFVIMKLQGHAPKGVTFGYQGALNYQVQDREHQKILDLVFK